MIRAKARVIETRYYETTAANGARMRLKERIRVADVSGVYSRGYVFAIVAERQVFVTSYLPRIPELAFYWAQVGEEFARSHIEACDRLGGPVGKFCPVFTEQEWAEGIRRARAALGWEQDHE